VSHRSWDVALAEPPERRIGRAGLVVRTSVGVLALDADAGELARLPGIPKDGYTSPLALSPDGSRLLLLEQRTGSAGRLHLVTLATGAAVRFDPPAGTHDRVGAISPDGDELAVLSTVGDEAVLARLAVSTGVRRRLWSAPGGWSDESAVSWSPDGRLVAATYLDEETDDGEEYAVTVVVDAAGARLARLHDANLLPASNGAWTRHGHLAVVDEETGNLHLVTPDGSEGPAIRATDPGHVRAVLGDRIVVDGAAPGRTVLTLAELDGSGGRPLLALRPRAAVTFLDLAPAALRDAGLLG
jgi:dipeptidyl aminopeptidase/acylaminoacyl peptidase